MVTHTSSISWHGPRFLAKPGWLRAEASFDQSPTRAELTAALILVAYIEGCIIVLDQEQRPLPAAGQYSISCLPVISPMLRWRLLTNMTEHYR